ASGPDVIALTGAASTGAANTTESIALKIRRTSRVANESSDMRKRPFQCWAIWRKQPRRGPNGWVVKLGGTARRSARTPELDAVTGDVSVNPWVAVVDVVGTALGHNAVDVRAVQVRGRENLVCRL